MRKTIYKGPIFTLEQFDVKINNKTYKRDILDHKTAVAVLVKKDDKFIFVKQMRYGIMTETLEIPAGLVDDGEDPQVAASRELQEEIGLKPINLKHFYSLYPVPAYCNEIVHFYFTDNVDYSKLASDPDEDLKIVELSLNEVIDEMNKPNTIFDMKTVIAIQYFLLKQKGW